jgi:hypothetical protein
MIPPHLDGQTRAPTVLIRELAAASSISGSKMGGADGGGGVSRSGGGGEGLFPSAEDRGVLARFSSRSEHRAEGAEAEGHDDVPPSLSHHDVTASATVATPRPLPPHTLTPIPSPVSATAAAATLAAASLYSSSTGAAKPAALIAFPPTSAGAANGGATSQVTTSLY